MTKTEKFYRWLYDYSKRKIKRLYLDRVKHDRKCINCKTWYSETNGCGDIVNIDDMREDITCKKCGFITRWDHSNGMFPKSVKRDQTG